LATLKKFGPPILKMGQPIKFGLPLKMGQRIENGTVKGTNNLKVLFLIILYG
jgi:hypothetical protein